jgi:hypothetical protein
MNPSTVPARLSIIAAASIGMAVSCAVLVAADELLGRRHKMAIMDLVWFASSYPVNAWLLARGIKESM